MHWQSEDPMVGMSTPIVTVLEALSDVQPHLELDC